MNNDKKDDRKKKQSEKKSAGKQGSEAFHGSKEKQSGNVHPTLMYLIEKGAKRTKQSITNIRDLNKQRIKQQKPLDALIDEKITYNKAKAAIYPVLNYGKEFLPTIILNSKVPDVHRHPDYPESFLIKNAINEFYTAKNVLELSIESGAMYKTSKRNLLRLMKAFEKDYINGKSIKKPAVIDDIVEYEKRLNNMIEYAEKISENYARDEEKLRNAVGNTKKKMLKEAGIPVAVTAGVVGASVLAAKYGVVAAVKKTAETVGKKIVGI